MGGRRVARCPAASGRIRRSRVRVGAGCLWWCCTGFFGRVGFAFGLALAGPDLAFGLALFGGAAFGLVLAGLDLAFGLAFFGGAAFGLALAGFDLAFGLPFFSGFAFFFAGLAVFRPVGFDDRLGRLAALALRGLCRAESLRDFLVFLAIRCRRRQLTTADKYHIVLCLSQIRGGAPCPLPQTEEILTA